MQPLSIFFFDLVRSGQGVDQFVQARNLTTGGSFMDDPFGSRFVDVWDCPIEGGLSYFFFTLGNGRADLLNKGAHGGADMGIAGSANGRLFIAFDCGFVISQCGCPPV